MQSSLKLPLVQPKIVVKKRQRKLVLHSDGKVAKTYRIGLGFSPAGDKNVQGDGRTPEGEFYVCSKNPQSKFYLSLGLSYPNQEDAERGFRERLITKAQYNQIVRAIRKKERPPWNTRLGGEIFIHGHGASSDWTLGCIALENVNMKELYEAIPKGTPVIIEP